MAQLNKVRIESITVRDRSRKAINGIRTLANSIDDLGLLHPIVLDNRLRLIVGGRRLEALKLLGRTEAPCLIVEHLSDAADALRAEQDENTCRVPLTPTEATELTKRIKELEAPEAMKRMAEGQKAGGRPQKNARAKKPRVSQDESKRTDSVAAKAAGMSRTTLRKAEAVTKAAEYDPERFGDLPDRMDTDNVDAAYKELQRRNVEQKVAGPPKDQLGRVIKHKHVASAFARADELKQWKTKVHALARELNAIDPVIGAYVNRQQIDSDLKSVAANLRFGIPYAVCPCCKGKKCENCRQAGWVPKEVYERIPESVKK